MVSELKKGGRIIYVCDACGFNYKEKKFAKMCEDYCKKHKSCNLEIAKHAINEKND